MEKIHNEPNLEVLSLRALFVGFAVLAAVAGAPTASAAPASQALTLTWGSRLMIDGRIYGRAVQALLDSAAAVTMLDRDLARTLELGSGQAVSGQGSGQGSFEAALVDGVSIEAQRMPCGWSRAADLRQIFSTITRPCALT